MKLDDWYKYLQIALGTATLLFVMLVMVGIAWEASQDTVSVEPIQVAQEITSAGYTPRLVAQRLIEHMLEIYEYVPRRLERGDLEAGWSQPDFVLPAAGFSIRSAAGYLRRLFSLPVTTVSGELLYTPQDMRATLRLRVNGARVAKLTRENDGAGIDELLRNGARQVLEVTEPYILAHYYYDTDRSRVPALLLSLLGEASDAKEEAQVIALLGNLFMIVPLRMAIIATYSTEPSRCTSGLSTSLLATRRRITIGETRCMHLETMKARSRNTGMQLPTNRLPLGMPAGGARSSGRANTVPQLPDFEGPSSLTPSTATFTAIGARCLRMPCPVRGTMSRE